MAMAAWPSSPPGGTLKSVLLLLLFTLACVGQAAAPNARPACPECGESPASVATSQDPSSVADTPDNDAAPIPDEAAGPHTSMVTAPEAPNNPVQSAASPSIVTKTARPLCCNQDPEPAPTDAAAPPVSQPAPPVEKPSIFTTIYVEPMPPIPDSGSQAPPPAPPVDTSLVVESSAAPPPPVCCTKQPPADPVPSPSTQAPPPQAPSLSSPVAAPPAASSSAQASQPEASSMSSEAPPPVATSASTQAPAPDPSSSSSEAPQAPPPSSGSQAPPPQPPSSSSQALPPPAASSSSIEPSQETETSITTSSSSSQPPQETPDSLSGTRPDESTTVQPPPQTTTVPPESLSTIASSIGEDEQATSEVPPPNSSERQSETPTALPSSASKAGQSTSETLSPIPEAPKPGTEVLETETSSVPFLPVPTPATTIPATQRPGQTETEQQPDPSQEPSQEGTQNGTEEKPAPTSQATSDPKSSSAGNSDATTSAAGNTSKDTPAASTSAKGEQPATGTPANPSKSGTTAANTSAKTDAPSSSVGGEPTTDGSNTESSGSTAPESSSSPSSTDDCKPNSDEDGGGHGSPNPLFDAVMPPGFGWAKSVARVALEALGYDPDTGKEDTRPPCPTESGTEDEDEEEEDEDEDTLNEGDDDDDDDILPPPGGTDDTNGKDKKKPKPKGGGGGGGGGRVWPPGPPPAGGKNGPGGGEDPNRRPTRKPKPKSSPGNGVKTDPGPTNPENTPNPSPEPTTPPDPDCTPVVFDAGCVQDCTSFSYTRPNVTSTWTECGGEECSLETGCEPTPALTETSWTTRTCSKTITQTDLCKQVCTEHVSPLSSMSDYTTETRCASSVSCRPTVVCDEQEATTTTSYTTKTVAPTHACYAMEEDLEARLAKIEEQAAHPGNNSEPGALQRRQVDGYNLIDFNRLTTWTDLAPYEWYRAWRRAFETKGVGSPPMAFAQYKDDDFLPNHAVYVPLRDIPAATGIRNMAGCSAVVVASPHGVYVGHFWEVPTFRAPGPDVVSGPLKFDYNNRRETFVRRVLAFLRVGNLRWRYDSDGEMAPDPNSPASPSLEQLAWPGGPFHDLKSMDWHFVALMHPGVVTQQAPNGAWANAEAFAEWRDAIRRTLSPDNRANYLTELNASYKTIRYRNMQFYQQWAAYDNIEQFFETYPEKNALVVQYAPAVPNPNNPQGRPSRQLRIIFNGRVILSKTWCAPPAAEMLPLPPNLPDNTGLLFPLPRRPAPGAVRLAARQEGEETDESEMETLTCPAQPWKVCAVDVAQTVVPTMGPSIQGTIDVTDEQGLRAHLESFENVPFGGFVSSEPEENHLGYNVTMRFDGEWDKFLVDKGYACNCTNDGCDLYSAQCCSRGDCPQCDCADGVCQAGSPECCQDNSCNATRPSEPTDYPFKAWDVKVAIEGEKGALDDEHAWAKDVSCTATKWDYLNETEVDGYCMAHRNMRCTWVCDQYEDNDESSLEWFEKGESSDEK